MHSQAPDVGAPSTLEALRTHIFNGAIWPDFTRLPTADQPILRLQPFHTGDVLQLGARRIELDMAAFAKAGYVQEGTMRECWDRGDGAWVDCHAFGMLAREWRTRG